MDILSQTLFFVITVWTCAWMVTIPKADRKTVLTSLTSLIRMILRIIEVFSGM